MVSSIDNATSPKENRTVFFFCLQFFPKYNTFSSFISLLFLSLIFQNNSPNLKTGATLDLPCPSVILFLPDSVTLHHENMPI